MIKLAKLAGAPVYFVHLSTKDALKEIKKAKKHQRIFSETCPQYFLLSQNRYSEPDFNGAKYVMSPPLRESSHLKAIFKAIKKDRIDVVATDHALSTLIKKNSLAKMILQRFLTESPE